MFVFMKIGDKLITNALCQTDSGRSAADPIGSAGFHPSATERKKKRNNSCKLNDIGKQVDDISLHGRLID